MSWLSRYKDKTEYLTSLGIAFKTEEGNYSAAIFYGGNKDMFYDTGYNGAVFGAFAKVHKDVKAAAKKRLDDDSIRKIKYFDVANLKSTNYDTVLNLDLNNAYATSLYNLGYVTDDTYSYLMKLKKAERLVSVGMLASRKMVKIYNDKGEIIQTHLRNSTNYADVFFAISKNVDDCMQEIISIAGDSFIFYWFDGMYFKNNLTNKQISDIHSVIDNYNFKYKKDELSKFSIRDRENGYSYDIAFLTGSGKKKNFIVPNMSLLMEYSEIRRCISERQQ